MVYAYKITLSRATLSKMRQDGSDVDAKPVSIGSFKSDADARQACVEHHAKACRMADAAGRVKPTLMFV